jgi:hypothetical protein
MFRPAHPQSRRSAIPVKDDASYDMKLHRATLTVFRSGVSSLDETIDSIPESWFFSTNNALSIQNTFGKSKRCKDFH